MRRGGEEEKERAQTRRQCKYWVSTKTASSVSSHLFIHLPFFFSLHVYTSPLKYFPFHIQTNKIKCAWEWHKRERKHREIFTSQRSHMSPWFSSFTPHTPILPTVSPYLLVHTHSIQAVVHDADPAVLTRQHKERHQRLAGWYAHKSASLSWKQSVRADVWPRVWQTCPRLSKLYFRLSQR